MKIQEVKCYQAVSFNGGTISFFTTKQDGSNALREAAPDMTFKDGLLFIVHKGNSIVIPQNNIAYMIPALEAAVKPVSKAK